MKNYNAVFWTPDSPRLKNSWYTDLRIGQQGEVEYRVSQIVDAEDEDDVWGQIRTKYEVTEIIEAVFLEVTS